MIKTNLQKIQTEISEVCVKKHCNQEHITLIAVSKTKPLSMLKEVYSLGVKDFGENKVQELIEKCENMPKDIKWHMLGHLQRNKVKCIVGKTELIHSVDSMRLAETIEKEAAKINKTVNILLEVNIAKEESKYGFFAEEVIEILTKISIFTHIQVMGLMTIAPFVSNPEENRVHFRKLNKLFVDIDNQNIDNVNMSVLSMGMTNDYKVAIEEGATMVRIGTGIFGERDYLI